MYKKISTFIMYLLFCSNVFSGDISGTYFGFFTGNEPYAESSISFIQNTYEAKITFDDDTIPTQIKNEVTYDNRGGWQYIEKGTFVITDNNGIFYIDWTGSKIFSKYGILYNEYQMCLFDNNQVVFYAGTGSKFANTFPVIIDIKASSELLENNTLYRAKNMLNSSAGVPWVEGVPGYGIGETITINISSYSKFQGFIISNGFVDFVRPDLYRRNSRIKTIEIISPTEAKMEYFLADTSLFQSINLPENMIPPESIQGALEYPEYKIIIKDVYRGDSWNDTCINKIDIIIPLYHEN